MKNLKNYILEGKEVYYILYLEDLSTYDDLNSLDEIKPVCVLKSSDYDEEEDQIRVKGEWEFYASENTNYYDDDNNQYPQAGDLVFETSSFALYRPGLNTPTGDVNDNSLIGTLEDIKNYCKEYSKEFSQDYDCDMKKILANTK